MAKKDKDRDDERPVSSPAPVGNVGATPKPSTVQQQSEKVVGTKPSSPAPANNPKPPAGPDPAGYGNNKWGGYSGGSLSGTSGDSVPKGFASDRPKPQEPDLPNKESSKPPAQETPRPPAQGRSKQRGSELSLKRSPEGRTKQDAASKKEPRREQRDTKKATQTRSPEGRTTQDAARKKPEVVCKAPPRGNDAKPKGGAGSGKRFIPYQGSRYCK